MTVRIMILIMFMFVFITPNSVILEDNEELVVVIEEPITIPIDADSIFIDVVNFVIEREGYRYVNDTAINEESKMGITTHTYKRYYGYIHDNSILNLRKAQAVAIYKKFYWIENRLDSISLLGYIKTVTALMDSEVNLGSYRANKMFQEIMGMPAINRNGRIDSVTLCYLSDTELSDDVMYKMLIDERRDFYKRLVTRRPVFARYEQGWYNRLDSIVVFVGDV